MKESHISSQMWEKDQDKEKERGKTQWKRLYNVTVQKKTKNKLNESGMCPYRRQWLLHSQIETGRIKKRLQSGAGRQATGRRHSLLRPVHATELMTCFSTDIWGAGSRAKREKLDWRREILKVIMRWCNGGGGFEAEDTTENMAPFPGTQWTPVVGCGLLQHTLL